VSEIAIDASLALQSFLEDEVDRGYSLAVLEKTIEFNAIGALGDRHVPNCGDMEARLVGAVVARLITVRDGDKPAK